MAKKALIGVEIEGIVADIYRNHKDATGKEICEIVNCDSRMKGRVLGLSTIQTFLAKWHKNEKELIAKGISINPLDRPWTIGLSMKYGIPAEMVPIIVILKRVSGEKITLRLARWFSYLYPTLHPWIIVQHPEDNDRQRLGLMVVIARQYSYQEEISEIITGEVTPMISGPDTSKLDSDYFMNQDLSDDAIVDNVFRLLGDTDADIRTYKDYIKQHPDQFKNFEEDGEKK